MPLGKGEKDGTANDGSADQATHFQDNNSSPGNAAIKGDHRKEDESFSQDGSIDMTMLSLHESSLSYRNAAADEELRKLERDISAAGSLDKIPQQQEMQGEEHKLPPVAPSQFGKVEPAHCGMATELSRLSTAAAYMQMNKPGEHGGFTSFRKGLNEARRRPAVRFDLPPDDNNPEMAKWSYGPPGNAKVAQPETYEGDAKDFLDGIQAKIDGIVAEIRDNQSELEHKFSDVIVGAVERMTELRYGSQARAIGHEFLSRMEEVKQEMLHHNDTGSMELVKNTCKLIGDWRATEQRVTEVHHQSVITTLTTEIRRLQEGHLTAMRESTEFMVQTMQRQQEETTLTMQHIQEQMAQDMLRQHEHTSQELQHLNQTLTSTSRAVEGHGEALVALRHRPMTSTPWMTQLQTPPSHSQSGQSQIRQPTSTPEPRTLYSSASITPNAPHVDTPMPQDIAQGNTTRQTAHRHLSVTSVGRSGNRQGRHHTVADIQTSNSSSDDGFMKEDLDESRGDGEAQVQRSYGHHRTSVPPFTGKETWKVWFTRFDEIAKRQKLNHEQRLDMLLPKLRGEAGTFVFDQLNPQTRSNYRQLTRELENRFRKVENPKTFGTVFAARRQKPSEGVEAYAAELKKLYDKAYANRDARTRDEDLLMRFLDGLLDNKASLHVELVKSPKNIDEAVDEVVNFQEVKKKQVASSRAATRTLDASTDSTEERDSAEIARAPGRPTRKAKESDDQPPAIVTNATQNVQNNGMSPGDSQANSLLDKLNDFLATSSQRRYPRPASLICFRCNQPGHFARECPLTLAQLPPWQSANHSQLDATKQASAAATGQTAKGGAAPTSGN